MKFITIITLYLIASVYATCQCRTYSDGSRRNGGCEDIELMEECKRAEWELVDWVNSVVEYAKTFIQAHPSDLETDTSNLAHLSYAVEINRPVPDCATGLFTTERVDGTSYQCYSANLLDQCEYVKDNIEYYISDVVTQLRNKNATDDFVALMEKRVIESIIPTITCQTTEDITNDSDMAKLNVVGFIMACILLI